MRVFVRPETSYHTSQVTSTSQPSSFYLLSTKIFMKFEHENPSSKLFYNKKNILGNMEPIASKFNGNFHSTGSLQ